MSVIRTGVIAAAMVLLAACASPTIISPTPTVAQRTATHAELLSLPPPPQPITVAVYRYQDQTGQFEFSDTVQTLSRAVTQGGTSILLGALLDAGGGRWFQVVEREGLDNLLRERQIIRETRAIYQPGIAADAGLPPLLFAGMILEGGIIGFDTNTATGGAGAALLGIGGSTQYRVDTVNVYLRATSTNTGEVLAYVNVSKTIYSVSVAANVFRFIDVDEILEVDVGVTQSEPDFLAVKQAIEKAVVALVLRGVERGYWGFAEDTPEARELLEEYIDERDDALTLDAVFDPPPKTPEEEAVERQALRRELFTGGSDWR